MTDLAVEIAAGVAIVSGAGAIAIMVVMMAVIHRQTTRIVACTRAIVEETVRLNQLLGQEPDARLTRALGDASASHERAAALLGRIGARLAGERPAPLAPADELDAALANRRLTRDRA